MLSLYWQRIVNNIKTTYLLPVGAEHSLEISIFYVRFGFESWKCRRSRWRLHRQWCCRILFTFCGFHICSEMCILLTMNNLNIACFIYYLAPGGGCEVLFSPGLSVCVCVCVCVCICVSSQYFGILFLGY